MRFIFPIEFRRTLPDMGEKRFADEVVQVMARKFRILTLGGVAVISHGLSRNTHDLDVWCEPLELSAEGDPFARDHLAALEKASKLP